MSYGLNAQGSLVFDGNSLSAGYLSNVVYPTVVQNLYGSPAGLAFRNASVLGQDTAAMMARGASFVDIYKSPQPVNVVIAWEGTNAIANGASAASAFEQMTQYAQARKNAGWKVAVLTVLPRGDALAVGVGFEGKRQAYNALLKSCPVFDRVIDVAVDKAIGDYGQEQNWEAYFADKTHLEPGATWHLAALVAEKLADFIKAIN